MADSTLHELADLYHTARVTGAESRYDRLCWATREYVKAHPAVTPVQAYKLACESIEHLPVAP